MPKKTNPIGRVNKLYNRGLLVLSREMERLVQLSIVEKLSDVSSKHLVAYVKLLGDMKKAQEAIVAEIKAKAQAVGKNLTEEELERAIKEAAFKYDK